MKTLIILILSSASVFAANITGTVVLPDGQPAAGAQVTLAISNYPVRLGDKGLQGYPGLLMVRADDAGRFSIPMTNNNASAIIAMGGRFTAEIERADFQAHMNIVLRQWGRIEGVLRSGRGPGTNQQVVVSSPGGARLFLDLDSYQVWTDRDGAFHLPYVPPGTWKISHRGRGEPVTVRAGETNHVVLGGTGRPVIGRLLMPQIVTNAPNQAWLPPGGAFVQFSNAAAIQGRKYMVKAVLYQGDQQSYAKLDIDGSFRVEDVTPGTWWLLADILDLGAGEVPKGGRMATTLATAGRKVVVLEIPGGRNDEPLDLGTLAPVMVRGPQVGEAAPEFEVKTGNGKTFNLADHRGQYVLLDFEPCYGSTRTNQSVEEAWDLFGMLGLENRLAMLTLRVPPMSSYFYDCGADLEYRWPQARLWESPWYELKPLRASFGLQCDRSSIYEDTNLPSILLVGPDGKIVARDLRGDGIKTAIAKALTRK